MGKRSIPTMFSITRSFICVIMIVTVLGVKVYFEKAHVVSINPKYLSYAFLNVTRYHRRGNYYINFVFANKVTVANDITVTIKVFEYRWNNYYRSILEFRHQFCDFIEKDVYFGAGIGETGLNCPVIPGKHHVMNLSAHFESFPNAFPFDKARVNVVFNLVRNGDLVAEGAVYIKVKNEMKNKNRT